MLPLEANARSDAGRASTSLRMVVIRKTGASERATALARRLYGLTGRERDVLFGLVEVGGVPATAAALGLSPSSTRSYLKSLFRKTETSRQADLVKLVATMESPFDPPAGERAATPPPGPGPAGGRR